MQAVELDHVILLTPRLEPAVRAFESAGFTVLGGGRFPASVPFHNALVVFENDLYIELLGIRSRLSHLGACALRHLGLLARRFRHRPLVERRILGLIGQPEGFADLCARVRHLDVESLREISGCRWEVFAMQRETPSGAVAAWELAFPEEPRLPFLIRDHTPRDIRIPVAPRHPNGLRTIESFELSVAGLPAVASAYQKLFSCDSRLRFVSQGASMAITERSEATPPAIGVAVTLGTPQSHRLELDALARRFRGLRFGRAR